MPTKQPLCVYSGQLGQLQSGDNADIGVPLMAMKNRLINGSFIVQQRGSFTHSALAGDYWIDQWRNDSNVNPLIDVTPTAFTIGQTAVPGNPRFYADLNCNIAPAGQTSNTYSNRIEYVTSCAGQTVTLSFWAKAAAAISLGSLLRQSFGTGGSPSADVDSSTTTHSLTTAWQKFTHTVTLASVSGKTLGSNGNDFLAVVFNLPQNASFQIDIANVQLELGANATDFEYRHYQQELDLCIRYFQRVGSQAPSTSVSTSESISLITLIGLRSGGTAKLNTTSTTLEIPGTISYNNTSSVLASYSQFANSLRVGITGFAIAAGNVGKFAVLSPDCIDISAEL